ncbi:uncharacterized protein Dvar_40620 [Desulfosarcina variabilis str. Montpellier]
MLTRPKSGRAAQFNRSLIQIIFIICLFGQKIKNPYKYRVFGILAPFENVCFTASIQSYHDFDPINKAPLK